MLRQLSAIIIIISSGLASAAQVTIKQSLDSTQLLMGRTTTLRIELVGPATGPDAAGQIVVDKAEWPAEVEISTRPGADRSDTTMHGNDRREIRRELTLQSFDSGLYTIPPILYVVGRDTVARSQRVALKVMPVMIDSMAMIHDYAPVEDGGSRWYDWMPDWIIEYGIWLLLCVLCIIGGFLYWRRLRRKKQGLVVKPVKADPPYVVAIKELEELRSRHLCEKGEEKQYYTVLTDILRNYLHDAFGISAMEMTSSQIMDSLRSDPSLHLSKSQMQRVLQMADYVKFAKMRPLPTDNQAAYDDALSFVNATSPKPEQAVTPDQWSDGAPTNSDTPINL